MYKVIITRPAERINNFIQLLEQQGLAYINIPCLEISCVDYKLDNIAYYNKFIFVSISAVDCFFRSESSLPSLSSVNQSEAITLEYNFCIENRDDKILSNIHKIYAIGKATATRLSNYGVNKAIYNKNIYQQNSEGLVSIIGPDLQKDAKNNILIIRGDTTRGYLLENLKNSKDINKLDELIVYKTTCPDGIIDDVDINYDSNKLIIIVTSVSILKNFYNKLSIKIRSDILSNSKVLVASDRIGLMADELGFSNIYSANTMVDSEIFKYILKITEN